MSRELRAVSIVVCGIVRDAAKGLRANIPVIDALCSKVKDWHVVIYENDSRDGTKALLTQWQASNPERIHAMMSDTDGAKTIPAARSVSANPFFSRRRIDKMARLRNQYMAYVDAMGWQADFLIVVDMDVAQLKLAGIIDTLTNDTIDWDAVVANGYSLSPRMRRRYHDTYALTLWQDRDKPQTEAMIRSNADRLGTLRPGDEWIRIASGFGGIAIYRFQAIRGLRYRALPNDDERVEVRCEHYSLYKQMAERGHDRFYINPAMEVHYQRLSWRIVWASLRRIVYSLCAS